MARGGRTYTRKEHAKAGSNAKRDMAGAPKYNKPGIVTFHEEKISISGSKRRERGRSPSHIRKPRP
jgi:hypothetical protein